MPSIRSGTLISFALAGAFFLPASAFAFVEIARGELLLHTTALAGYDSNIFGRSDAEGDVFFSLTPELHYMRRAGRGAIDARAGVDVTRFVDFTDENFEGIFGSLNLGYPVHEDSPLSGGFFTAYTQRRQANEFLNTRVRSDIFSAGLNSNYRLSDRTSLRNSLSYSHTETRDFSNVEDYAGTLGLQWMYSENLLFFSDYRLRRSLSAGNGGARVDNINHALFLGATGTLSPRVEGTVSAGYQHTDARGAGSDTGLVVTTAQLAWAWRPRTSVTLSASRDLDVSPTDETVESSVATLGVTHQVDEKIGVNAFVGYHHFSFRAGDDRRDDRVRAGTGASYVMTRYWNAGVDYEFIASNSNRAEADFSRHITRIFTRYSF